MDNFIPTLKAKVVETLNLMDVKPEDIDENDPLVGGNLGIDSIDILELVMMLEKDYGIRIDGKEEGARVFATLRSMADHIRLHAPERIAGVA